MEQTSGIIRRILKTERRTKWNTTKIPITPARARTRSAQAKKAAESRIVEASVAGSVILIIAGLAMDSFYTLTEDQYAVITTFGKPTTVSASGLQMKIRSCSALGLVSKSIQGFPLGYRTDSSESVDDESLMITYDYNFVNVDFLRRVPRDGPGQISL